MFSGIVETVGLIDDVDESRHQRIVTIKKPRGWRLAEGESISVEGVCSTVQQTNGRNFRVVYMPETLRKTTAGSLRPGDAVNLERSLSLASLIGGHLIQGHVDTTALIREVAADGSASLYTFELPNGSSRYIVPKGSVAIDGISLTVMNPRRKTFQVSLLEYTLVHTTLGGKRKGDRVNIEFDILAKYVERLLKR